MIDLLLDLQTMKNEDKKTLALCSLHLKRASSLIKPFDSTVSETLIQLAKTLLDAYAIGQSDVDDIESIEKEIIGEDK